MKKILVTRRLLRSSEDRAKEMFDANLNLNDELYSQKKLIEMSQGCDGILSALTDKLDADTINQLPDSIKILSNFAVGFGNIDLEAAKNRGIAVTNTPDVLTDATAEIGMSSRDPKDKEVAKAKAKGVDMKAITMAKDGIAIIVNESNLIESISLEEIELIFSGDVTDWSGITAQTGEISAYTRNTSSGTYAVFQKLGMNSRDYGVDSQKMAGNEQIAAEVANNPNGIGYVGLAYIKTPGVKVLPVDGSMPEDPSYPIARPLYYLIDNSKQLSPLANDFIGFSMSPEGQNIVNRVNFLSIY